MLPGRIRLLTAPVHLLVDVGGGVWSQLTWGLVAVNFGHSQHGKVIQEKQQALLIREVTGSSCWAQEPEPLPQPPAPQLQPLALP